MSNLTASVTLIMIVRNGAAFVREALESVFQSTRLPEEILIIDGQSTDSTLSIVNEFEGIQVIGQTGSGIASAYNQGINIARGEFLTFLSHDDLWLPEKLDLQMKQIVENPTIIYSVTLVEHFLSPDSSPPLGFRLDLLDTPVPGFIMESMLVRKEAFAQIGMFDPRFVIGEDSDWFMRAKDAGLISDVLQKVLVRKRVHKNSATLSQTNLINENLMAAVRKSVDRKRSKPH